MEDKAEVLKWLEAERAFVNERIAAYSEAEQKIISVTATIIATLLGLLLTDAAKIRTGYLPYSLFLASGLLSLAVLQSTIYSSIGLIFMQRKVKLAERTAQTLNVDEDFAYTQHSMFGTNIGSTYGAAMVSYYGFKCSAPVIIAIGGLALSEPVTRDASFYVAGIAAILLGGAGTVATALHFVDVSRFARRVRAGAK